MKSARTLIVGLSFLLSAGFLPVRGQVPSSLTDRVSGVETGVPGTDSQQKITRQAMRPSSAAVGGDSSKTEATPSGPSSRPATAPTAQGSTVVPSEPEAPPTYPTFVGRSFDRPTTFTAYLLSHNRLFNDSLPPEQQLMPLSISQGRGASHQSMLFYLLLGVFFLLALIRMGFSKYFQDLFQAFISPTLSQRQLKDQLHQTPFPAFALNVFFSLSAGIYLYLVLLKAGYIPDEDPLYLAALFIVFLMFAYSFKYVILRICGWLFGYSELMDNYIFILFLINKIQGVILLPFILLLAFSTPGWSNAAMHISIVLVALLFIYRYIRIFPMIKSQIAFSKFFFLLYICAFELAPILIIGKLTLLWLKGT